MPGKSSSRKSQSGSSKTNSLSELDLRAWLDEALLPQQEWPEFLASIQQPPRPAIRWRHPVPDNDRAVPWLARGQWIEPTTRVGQQWQYAAGEFYSQDAASMLALSVLDAQPGERICDLCAAPGGKATGILETLTEGYLLVNEPVQSRLAPLRLNLARHGGTNFAVSSLDPRVLSQQLAGEFDAVLVDAPCSGQTLYARGKQSAGAFTARQIEHSAARQERILQAAAQLVRVGGRLVYCTCTFATQENEQQVTKFLNSHPGWKVEPVPNMQSWESNLLAGCYRLWPHRHHCGGAFAVRLRRFDGPSLEAGTKRTKRAKRANDKASRNVPVDTDQWGKVPAAMVLAHGQVVYAWPMSFPSHWIELVCGGPELAHQTGRTWQPSYALAMRRDPSWQPREMFELSKEQVTDYLTGHPVNPCTTRGWSIATYRKSPLGWLKGDGKVGKNHLPKSARLSHVATEPL